MKTDYFDKAAQQFANLMIEKIQSSLVNTIPLWKSQMVLSLGLEHSRQATAAQSAVTNMTNELLRQNADMLKGMVSLAVSAIALLVFTLVVFVLFGEAFRMFLLGEAIGFVAFMAACTVRVAKALRDPHEVER